MKWEVSGRIWDAFREYEGVGDGTSLERTGNGHAKRKGRLGEKNGVGMEGRETGREQTRRVERGRDERGWKVREGKERQGRKKQKLV